MSSITPNSFQKPNFNCINAFSKRSSGLAIVAQVFGVLALTIVSGALMPRSPAEKAFERLPKNAIQNTDAKKEEGQTTPQARVKDAS